MPGGRERAAVDAVLATALALGAQLEVWAPHLVPGAATVVGDRPVLAVTSLAATLPLLVRRTYPLLVLTTVLAALGLQQALATPTEGLMLLLAAVTAAYSSSACARSFVRASAAGVVTVLGAAFVGEDAADWAFVAVVLSSVWLVGFVVMRRSTELHVARLDNVALSTRLADAAAALADAQRRLPARPGPAQLAALTAREVEVARAVARGMSNADIAAELYISEWTVKTHVASILRKLVLRDRAQIVVVCYESGLVEPQRSVLRRDVSPEPATSD